jgi:hypothetical protein
MLLAQEQEVPRHCTSSFLENLEDAIGHAFHWRVAKNSGHYASRFFLLCCKVWKGWPVALLAKDKRTRSFTPRYFLLSTKLGGGLTTPFAQKVKKPLALCHESFFYYVWPHFLFKIKRTPIFLWFTTELKARCTSISFKRSQKPKFHTLRFIFWGCKWSTTPLVFSREPKVPHFKLFFYLATEFNQEFKKTRGLAPQNVLLGSECLRGKLSVHFSERTWGSALWVFWVSHAFYSWGEENSKDWSPCFKKFQSSNNWVGHVSHSESYFQGAKLGRKIKRTSHSKDKRNLGQGFTPRFLFFNAIKDTFGSIER